MQRVRRFLKLVGKPLYVLIALPVALIYGLGISLRNWLYDKRWLRVHRLPCTVVSIGNLTLGGSGKTPFALYLMEWLSTRGVAVAYLSRGYGRKSRGFAEVILNAPQAAYIFGDEPCLVKARFPQIPVAVAEDRVAGGQALLQRYPHLQVIILDDAYQHRRIHRDLDILIIDVQRPIWKDWLFPLGRLREPLRAHRRAHLIILNKKTAEKARQKIRFAAPTLSFGYTAVGLRPAFEAFEPLPLETIRYKSAIAFCGIAYPESFYSTLRQLGVYVVWQRDFADHHLYTEEELLRLRRVFRRYEKVMGIQDLLLLTTEKDLVRLQGSGLLHLLERLPLYAVQITMKPEKPEEAESLLRHFFGNLTSI